jgi:hypothetical protein
MDLFNENRAVIDHPIPDDRNEPRKAQENDWLNITWPDKKDGGITEKETVKILVTIVLFPDLLTRSMSCAE